MSENQSVPALARRSRRPIWAAVVGASVAALLGLSFSPTVSAFLAQITNSTNTVSTGVLVMEEKNGAGTVTCTSTDGGNVSTNTATCATINKFSGGTVIPGTPVASQVTFKNTGTVTATSFTLTPGTTCTQSAVGAVAGSATDLCAKLNIGIFSGMTLIYEGTLADLAGGSAISLPAPVNAGATVPFAFSVTLDATAVNGYQGLQASLPLSWTFTA